MKTTTPHAALSIVFATCNRERVLRETLDHFARTDRQGLDLDLVVVDNSSGNDRTRSVIESFADRLPIRYLREARPGKNRALNCALDAGGFHPLVVFTDDDVQPAPDWLQAIVAVSARWPGHKVFGGKIVPTWPTDDPPEWVHDDLIRQFAFAAHDLGQEKVYPDTEQPFGPNFWLRREVLTPDVRFDESVGPGTGTLGDEMIFLHQFQRKGLEIVYSPQPVVMHRIQREGIDAIKLRERALMVGRIGPNMYGLCRPDRLKSSPRFWRLLRHIRLNQARLALLRAQLHPNPNERIVRSINPLIDIGYNTESLRLARQHAEGQGSAS